MAGQSQASSLSWDLVPPVKAGMVDFMQLGAQVSRGADIVLVSARRSSVSSGYPPFPCSLVVPHQSIRQGSAAAGVGEAMRATSSSLSGRSVTVPLLPWGLGRGLSSAPSMVDHPPCAYRGCCLHIRFFLCDSGQRSVWFISWAPIGCPGPGMPARSPMEPPQPLVVGVLCLRWWTLGRPLLDH